LTTLLAGSREIECKLVIFDKDGTLVDQHLLLLELAKARRTSIRRLAGVKACGQWEKMVGINLKSSKIDYSGPLAMAPCREEVLVASVAFYLNGRSWDDAKQLAERAYDEADASMKPPYGTVPLAGVEGTLKQLRRRGFKLAIASTDAHRRTVESLEMLKIASLFDAVVGGDDVLNGKPSPDMICEVLEKTESKADEAVMVGDSMSDMQMGRNARVKACVGVLTGSARRQKLEQLADVVIASVADLRVL